MDTGFSLLVSGYVDEVDDGIQVVRGYIDKVDDGIQVVRGYVDEVDDGIQASIRFGQFLCQSQIHLMSFILG